jgi:hypothetical protein
MLQSSPRVGVDDLKAMEIKIPSHSHTPSPVATPYPVCTVDSSTIRRLKIHFRDQNERRRAKPHGQHGAEIRWQLLDKPPASVYELVHSAFDIPLHA